MTHFLPRFMDLKRTLFHTLITLIMMTSVVILALIASSYLSVLAAETMPSELHNTNPGSGSVSLQQHH